MILVFDWYYHLLEFLHMWSHLYMKHSFVSLLLHWWRCHSSLQVLLLLNTNIIRMVKVTNSIECNEKHILKANYLITPFWNVPICSCLSFTCPLLWPIFPHFLQTIDFDYLGSLKLFLDSSFLLFLDFFGLPRAILITSGSITSVCKGGHKFGPLHG